MDKPLGAIQGIVLVIAVPIVALYAAWKMPLGGRANTWADYLRSIRQREGLVEDRVVLSQSIEAGHDIADRLFDRRLSLREAAAAMRDEIESRPEHLRPPLYPYERKVPREELYMLQFLIRAENNLHGDPRQGEVLKRLRAELQAYRAARTQAVSGASPKLQAATVQR
jgi:hypothetical protein